MSIVWKNIDNLHCYNGETRPQDGAALIAKIKYIGMNDVPYYEFRLCKYDAEHDDVWDTERDYCGSIPFDRVVSWIYQSELNDLM